MDANPSEQSATSARGAGRPRVIVATTPMLSFISFWRAAAVVLMPLLSSAFFAGGIAEQVIGKSAPWFIAAVMLFSGAVSAVYRESSSLMGLHSYREERNAIGAGFAKFSLSTLLLNYILMGPIRAVVAGQYFAGFLADTLYHIGYEVHIPGNAFSATFGVLVTAYFWWKNIHRGMHESSERALQIMKITTVMVIMLILWCTVTLIVHPAPLPPLPSAAGIPKNHETLGWLYHTGIANLTWVLMLVGFGHSVLAMSGEESLAQVTREIEHPRVRNVQKTRLVVFIYSLLFTSLVSFFYVMIIPDHIRPDYFATLISGLAMHVVGPFTLKLAFQAFVVIMGTLLLTMAADTSIGLSSGLIDRASEYALLPEWLRRRHPRFGTAYRTVTLVVLLQILTILLSDGRVLVLGAAYAFCLIWSFAAKAIVVLRLRFKEPRDREFRVALNIKVGRIEVPLGLSLVAITLLATAVVGLFTGNIGTISGIASTFGLFATFVACEQLNLRRRVAQRTPNIFSLAPGEDLTPQNLGVRPGNILVVLLDYNTIYNLSEVLDRVDTKRQDVVGLHIRTVSIESMELSPVPEELFTKKEYELLNLALNVAESKGKVVQLAVMAVGEIWGGILHAAQSIQSATIVLGILPRKPPREEFLLANKAWERLPEPKPRLTLEMYAKDSQRLLYVLGPHAPHLTPSQVELLHSLWLRIGEGGTIFSQELDHNDIVHFALLELKLAIEGPYKDEILGGLRKYLEERKLGTSHNS